MTMATWPHLSAKNKTDVLQEGLPTGSEGGLCIAGCTKHRWQSEPPSPGKNVMCRRWDTLKNIDIGLQWDPETFEAAEIRDVDLCEFHRYILCQAIQVPNRTIR